MDFVTLMADINDFVWGPVMLAFLVGTGIFLTIRLKFLPWRNLPYAIKMIVSKRDNSAGDISPFQSLMTALSATVGTGNRCFHGHGAGRSWCPGMDVDFRSFWSFHQVW